MILRVKMYDFWIEIIGQCQLNHGKSENRELVTQGSILRTQDPKILKNIKISNALLRDFLLGINQNKTWKKKIVVLKLQNLLFGFLRVFGSWIRKDRSKSYETNWVE